ncbi:hypothetical protein CAEBREN_30052 [Caenorhabditis brenneri]|uniref:Uncharacterized protein n=1 Tax=Caenorhabditis brenneri TaxID=135651 RepID=G0PIT6_CAEBE|nr:hypothetical protein CAEBREN_30052 [Caenorhabditis brenneri]
MLSGYELLIKAQCSESMNSLGNPEDSVIEALESEQRFDVKSRLCERIAFLIYQDSNFGLLAPSSESISACINRLCKSMTSFPIENETFVGPCTSSSTSNTENDGSNHSKERILCALLLTTPKGDLPTLLSSSSSPFSYPSTASFSQKLLGNDERFLTSMLALLPLIEELE